MSTTLELEKRTTALVHAFDQSFSTEQLALPLELAEHNESGVAVEMLSRMLVEEAVPVTRQLRDEFKDLVEMMQLDAGLWRDLTPAFE